MPTVQEYLIELDEQRDQLAKNLATMGIEADTSEKFNTLVPKVLKISPIGGVAATPVTIRSMPLFNSYLVTKYKKVEEG